MICELAIDDTEVYDSLPTFTWEKYQRGYLGILNNAYNQSCNAGKKHLGNMSKITSEWGGGSYEEFLDYYNEEWDGEEKYDECVEFMTDNLVNRVQSVGGVLPRFEAEKWSRKYIESMLVNSYRGFMDEARAIEIVANELDESWDIASPDEESCGVDGYIGDHSVQVKPGSYSTLDINTFDADWLITYTYSDGEFRVRCDEVTL